MLLSPVNLIHSITAHFYQSYQNIIFSNSVHSPGSIPETLPGFQETDYNKHSVAFSTLPTHSLHIAVGSSIFNIQPRTKSIMVRVAILASLGLSLGGVCYAAVIDGRETDILDDATVAETANEVEPFRLAARNVIKTDPEKIDGGVYVDWEDGSTAKMMATRQCIVGDGPAYFAVNSIGYFARDACNTVMNGHHGNGEALQPPG